MLKKNKKATKSAVYSPLKIRCLKDTFTFLRTTSDPVYELSEAFRGYRFEYRGRSRFLPSRPFKNRNVIIKIQIR